MILLEQRASLLWSIPHFRRTGSQSSTTTTNASSLQKMTSPRFGPEDSSWEVSLYPEGNGPTRGTHLGLFLDVILSQAEKESPNTWSRPITYFRLCILKPNRVGHGIVPATSTNTSSGSIASPLSYSTVLVKERHPQNKEGYGAGFSHPKSWGWATVFPLSRLQEALGADDTLYIHAEVVWQTVSNLTKMVSSASAANQVSCRSFGHLLKSPWLADVYFEVSSSGLVDPKSLSSFQLHRDEESSSSNDPCLNEDSFSSLKSTHITHDESVEDDSITIHSDRSSSSSTVAGCRTILIPAHKVILSSVNYFSTMFSCGLGESQASSDGLPRIHIADFDEPDVSYMLEYIYTGSIERIPSSFSAKIRLIRMADRYQLPGLYDLVSIHIIERHLSPEKCLDILELSHVYSSASTHLKSATLSYIKDTLADLKGTQQFQEWVRTTTHRDLLLDLFHVMI